MTEYPTVNEDDSQARAIRNRRLDLELAIRQDHVWIYSALESWRNGKPLWVLRNGEHFTDSAVSAFSRCKDFCENLVVVEGGVFSTIEGAAPLSAENLRRIIHV